MNMDVDFIAPSAQITVGEGEEHGPYNSKFRVPRSSLAETAAHRKKTLEDAASNARDFFERNLTDGGKAFYGRRAKVPLPRGVGRNYRLGQSYADIGHLPLHDKHLFPDPKDLTNTKATREDDKEIREELRKLGDATLPDTERGLNRIRIRKAKKKYFQAVLETDKLNQCRFSDRLVYDLVPEAGRFAWLRSPGLEVVEDFEWSDDEDMTELDDLVIKLDDLPPEVRGSTSEPTRAAGPALSAPAVPKPPRGGRDWDEDFLAEFKDTAWSMHDTSSSKIEGAAALPSGAATAREPGGRPPKGWGAANAKFLPSLNVPRDGDRLREVVHESGAVTDRGPLSVRAQADGIEEVMKMHPDRVAGFLCSKRGRQMLQFINKSHRKVLADRLRDLDHTRIESNADGLQRVLETYKMQVDSLGFKRAALTNQIRRGTILHRSAEDARHDVRHLAYSSRRGTHEKHLKASRVYKMLLRMRDELKRTERIDKPALEFFQRCKAVLGQGTVLDQVYLFRLIRSNSAVTPATQELIDVLLCELRVPLPGFLMWCMAHGYGHDKARIDEVLEAREEQRKRKRRKLYIAGREIPQARQKHRLVVTTVPAGGTVLTQLSLPPVAPDRTFLTQSHTEAAEARLTRRATTYPHAPEEHRVELKGQERWRQSLRTRLRGRAPAVRRRQMPDLYR